jgi:hypothetical protein
VFDARRIVQASDKWREARRKKAAATGAAAAEAAAAALLAEEDAEAAAAAAAQLKCAYRIIPSLCACIAGALQSTDVGCHLLRAAGSRRKERKPRARSSSATKR